MKWIEQTNEPRRREIVLIVISQATSSSIDILFSLWTFHLRQSWNQSPGLVRGALPSRSKIWKWRHKTVRLHSDNTDWTSSLDAKHESLSVVHQDTYTSVLYAESRWTIGNNVTDTWREPPYVFTSLYRGRCVSVVCVMCWWCGGYVLWSRKAKKLKNWGEKCERPLKPRYRGIIRQTARRLDRWVLSWGRGQSMWTYLFKSSEMRIWSEKWRRAQSSSRRQYLRRNERRFVFYRTCFWWQVLTLYQQHELEDETSMGVIREHGSDRLEVPIPGVRDVSPKDTKPSPSKKIPPPQGKQYYVHKGEMPVLYEFVSSTSPAHICIQKGKTVFKIPSTISTMKTTILSKLSTRCTLT